MEQSGTRGERPEDALRRLEARIERASDAAERLFAQAASEAAASATRLRGRAGGAPPPQGWQRPEEAPPAAGRGELDVLVAALSSVRDLIPPELRRRLGEAVKELLLAVRALIDWYVERVDRRPEQAADVEDIPIL